MRVIEVSGGGRRASIKSCAVAIEDWSEKKARELQIEQKHSASLMEIHELKEGQESRRGPKVSGG